MKICNKILAVFVLGLAVFTAGCGERVTRAEQAALDGVLLFGNGSEPKGLDPHLVTGVTENKIIQALIEGLIAYHPTDDNEPEAGMAERWEAHDNFSRWVFFLREAKWTNGDAVTANDFVYSIERILSPELGAEYAENLYVIENAEAFNKGTLEDFGDVGAKALDERTLEISLVGPTPHFLSVLKHYSWYPVNPRVVEEHGGMTARITQWTREGNFVGNGPFRLAEWKPNQVIRVEKNPHYWDATRVELNAIEFYPIENVSSEEQMFRAGQLHVTNQVLSDMIPIFRERDPELIRMDDYLGAYFYRLNVTRAPLDDLRVRLALSYAIDREKLVNEVTLGGQKPAGGIVPPGIAGYTGVEMHRFDPEKAKTLLAEAGYPGGQGFPSLEVLYNTDENHRKLAEAIQQKWKETLGIEVTLVNQEWKVYLDAQSNLDYQIARAGWIGDFMAPSTFLEMWTTGNGNNDTGWSRPEFDALIRASRKAPTAEAQNALLRQAEEMFLADAAIIPLYYYKRIYLLSPLVQGWNPKLLDNRPYKYLSFAGVGSGEQGVGNRE